jgi:hypothetical protein
MFRRKQTPNPTERLAQERLAAIRADIDSGVPAPPRTQAEVLQRGWEQINAERAARTESAPQPSEPTVRALGELTAGQSVANPIASPAALSRLEAIRTGMQVHQDLSVIEQMQAAPPHHSIDPNTHFGR